MSRNYGQIVWPFHNSATQIGNGNELMISGGMITANIEISGIGTGTLIFEGKSVDNGAWYEIMCANLKTLELASSTTTIGSLWQADLVGLIKFRVRISAITGTLNASARVVD